MKYNINFTRSAFVLCLFACCSGYATPYGLKHIEKGISPNEAQIPQQQFFIENKGQWHADVLYLVRTGGLDAWITKAGVTYDFYATEKKQSAGIMRKERETEETRRYGQVVRVTNQNANASPAPVGKNKSSAYYNYFIGNDESKWASNVGLYAEAQIENVYNGIAQRWYFENNNLRYDYIVEPNADYKQIQLSIEGAKNFNVKGNDLVFTTRFGEVKQVELLVYQNVNGTKKTINAQWQLQNGKASFVLGNYNPALPLVIDPLIYSTFIGNGGNGGEIGYSIAVDGSGNAYITGYTGSIAYPTTSGAYDQSWNNSADVFVTKLNSTGTALIYSTFIGGNNYEVGRGITIDSNGNAYITGETASTNFPTTAGAYDQTHNGNGGTYDVFVSKLNSAGTALIYSTFIGGSGNEYGRGITIDSNGNAYIIGETSSSNFSTTAGAYDQSFNGGGDVFVSKLNSTGTALIYSTFIGGGSYDQGIGITIDSNGDAYITGVTESNNFPTTAGAYDQSFNGGTYDVFVTKLDSTGTALIYSTFIGGSGYEYGRGITIDNNGDAYITGVTSSNNFPITAGAYDQTFNGNNDVFVTKLNSTGSSLLYSTFIGGSSNEEASGIVLDGNGNAYITGYTYSGNFPITAGAGHNGNYDVFACKLNSASTALLYSTFLGGLYNDVANGITLDNNKRAYITGYTQHGGYPTSTGAYDVTQHNDNNVFVTKIGLCIPSSATISPAACGSYTSPSGSHVYTSTGIYQDTLVNATGCDSLLTIYLTVNSVPGITANSGAICMGASFTIIATGSAISYTYSGGSAVVNPATNTAYTVTGANAQGCTGIAISNVTVNALPPVSITGGGTICVSQTTLLNAGGASTYTWSTGENSANITVSPSLTTNYSVQGTDNNGCQNSANVTLSVDECTGIGELKIESAELRVYPNPVNEILNVSPLTPKGGTVEVFNMLGSIVLEQTITPPLEGKGEATIHVGELEKGIYFIKVGNETRKFVKE